MKLQTTFRRLNPNTINGEQLVVTFHYYSYDKREIDLLEKDFREQLGDGTIVDLGKIDEQRLKEVE